MSEYITNDDGKWLVKGNVRFLINPSESFIAQKKLEEQQRLEEERLAKLIPSEFEQLSDYVLDVDFRLIMLEFGM